MKYTRTYRSGGEIFEISGEAFVEPRKGPPGRRHQVAEPLLRYIAFHRSLHRNFGFGHRVRVDQE